MLHIFMKRIIFCVVFLFLLVSCDKNSHHSLVKREFQNYVQRNFDNPKSFKEIVDISVYDTISIDRMRKLGQISIDGIEKTISLCKKRDSLANLEMHKLQSSLSDNYEGNYYNALKAQMLITLLASTIERKQSSALLAFSSKQRMKHILDTIHYSPAIYCYEVKYRRQTQEGIKLASAYAYVDSLSNFIGTYPEKNDENVMSEGYKAIYRESKKSLANVTMLEQVQEEYEKEMEKFIAFVKSIE